MHGSQEITEAHHAHYKTLLGVDPQSPSKPVSWWVQSYLLPQVRPIPQSDAPIAWKGVSKALANVKYETAPGVGALTELLKAADLRTSLH